MAGFDNGVILADNVDFTGTHVSHGSAQVTADGQLLIGSAVAPNIRVGTLGSSDGSITWTVGNGSISGQISGGTTVGKTISGNIGGPLQPSAGNWNIVGSGSITTSGSGNTLTLTHIDLPSTLPQVGALEYFPTANGTAYLTANWLLCDGSVYSQATYSVLFSAVGLINNTAQTWTSQTSGTTTAIDALASGNNLFVYGTASGNIATSTNGVTWTQRVSNTTSAILSLVYGSVWVAAGINVIASSTDAITWTVRTIPNNSAADYTNLSYDGSVYYANNNNASAVNILTSTDGTTWSTRYPLSFALTYGTKIVSSGINGYMNTSTDGLNWSSINSGTNTSISSLVYAASTYVFGTGNGGLSTSTDAVTWTPGTSGTASTINAIVYGTVFVLGANGGGISTSTDGLTWTARSSGTASSITALTYGTVYVLGGVGGVLRSSTDGITWSARVSNTTSIIRALTFGTVYVYAGDGGVIASSTDAITWTVRVSNTVNGLLALTYGGGIYVAAGIGGTIVSSTDATTWVVRTSNVPNFIDSATYTGSMFVLAGSGFSVTSTDGTTWTPSNSGYDANTAFLPMKYLNGKFVAVAGNKFFYTSTDAITWSKGSAALNAVYLDLTFGNNLYVAGIALTTSQIQTSTDGSTWTTNLTTTMTDGVESLAYANNVFVAGTFIGNIWVSYSGTGTWYKQPSPTVSNIGARTITSGGSSFVAGGAGGFILTSPNNYSYDTSTQFVVPTDANVVSSESNIYLTTENMNAFPRSLFIRYA